MRGCVRLLLLSLGLENMLIFRYLVHPGDLACCHPPHTTRTVCVCERGADQSKMSD